jgi:hypothetical protein
VIGVPVSQCAGEPVSQCAGAPVSRLASQPMGQSAERVRFFDVMAFERPFVKG